MSSLLLQQQQQNDHHCFLKSIQTGRLTSFSSNSSSANNGNANRGKLCKTINRINQVLIGSARCVCQVRWFTLLVVHSELLGAFHLALCTAAAALQCQSQTLTKVLRTCWTGTPSLSYCLLWEWAEYAAAHDTKEEKADLSPNETVFSS